MPDDVQKLSRLPNPSRMLLADECPEYYDALLSEYYEDLKPVGVLERRQIELIVRCDLDIDRQLRIIAQHLNPLDEEETREHDWWRSGIGGRSCIQTPKTRMGTNLSRPRPSTFPWVTRG